MKLSEKIIDTIWDDDSCERPVSLSPKALRDWMSTLKSWSDEAESLEIVYADACAANKRLEKELCKAEKQRDSALARVGELERNAESPVSEKDYPQDTNGQRIARELRAKCNSMTRAPLPQPTTEARKTVELPFDPEGALSSYLDNDRALAAEVNALWDAIGELRGRVR